MTTSKKPTVQRVGASWRENGTQHQIVEAPAGMSAQKVLAALISDKSEQVSEIRTIVEKMAHFFTLATAKKVGGLALGYSVVIVGGTAMMTAADNVPLSNIATSAIGVTEEWTYTSDMSHNLSLTFDVGRMPLQLVANVSNVIADKLDENNGA